MRRLGITLVEVALSILVVAVGVVAMAMYLPVAIRSQERARFEIYAAAKAIDIAEVLVNMPQVHNPYYFDPEAANPWDIPAGHRAFDPDIEIKASGPRSGICPLPPDIAYRIDSDGDEIRRLLDAGGHVYYAQPVVTNGLKADSTFSLRPPSDLRKLVFAVVGDAQANAISYLPWKNAPYRVQYPSPPTYIIANSQYAESQGNWVFWETGDDPDVAKVVDSAITTVSPPWLGAGNTTWHIGFKPHALYYQVAYTSKDVHAQALTAKGYVCTAWWYACRKGLPGYILDGSATPAQLAGWIAAGDRDQIRALRFLAHATACLTKGYALDPQAALTNGTANGATVVERNSHPGLRSGIPIPGEIAGTDPADVTHPLFGKTMADLAAAIDPGPLATPVLPPALAGAIPGMVYINHDLIGRYHDWALRAGVAFAANRPNDWTVPRPANQMLMTDHPLLQWDLVDTAAFPLLAGSIAGAADASSSYRAARQWRPVAATGVVIPGRNSFGSTVSWPAIAGDPGHFNLSAGFAPAERCRELVFWAVDWQGYQDFELAPSAPVDASRYPRLNPVNVASGTTFLGMLSAYRGTPYSPSVGFFYDHWQPESRNPEKPMAFIRDVSSLPTGCYVRDAEVGHDVDDANTGTQDQATVLNGQTTVTAARADYGVTTSFAPGTANQQPQAAFSGINGADRNYNQRLDRGPLPTSVRLRATMVARYQMYDPRLTLCLR